MKNVLIILFPIIVFISNASAQDCFAPSPTRQPGEKFPPIKTRELTKTAYDILNEFINSIVGDWHGTGQEVICSGNLPDPSREIIRYTIKGESTVGHYGKFTLFVELYAIDRNATHSDKQDVYLTENNFRAGSNNSAGDVEFLEISSNRIKYRQRAASNISRTGGFSQAETITTIRRTNNSLVFIQCYYLLGKLGRTKEWRLSK